MSSRHLEDMPSRRLQDMSSRRLQDVYWECLLGISVSKKSKSVSDKSISRISNLINQGESKMH